MQFQCVAARALVQARNDFFMLHVRALSGAPVAELHVEELKARLQETEDLLVVALKRYLGGQLGCSRFRLRLLGQDRQVLDDEAPLTGPADFTKRMDLDLQAPDVSTNEAFLSACKRGSVIEVERQLRVPVDPDARGVRPGWPLTGLLILPGRAVRQAWPPACEQVSLVDPCRWGESTTQEKYTDIPNLARLNAMTRQNQLALLCFCNIWHIPRPQLKIPHMYVFHY